MTLWLEGGYFGVTPTTSRLLAYWIAPDREKKKDKAAKAATARTFWVPAVNNHGGFGCWAFAVGFMSSFLKFSPPIPHFGNKAAGIVHTPEAISFDISPSFSYTPPTNHLTNK